MEIHALSPEQERFADALYDAFKLVEAVEGTKGAAQFVVALAQKSDEIIAETADHNFLSENGIDPDSI